jgi:hypothetical protein
VAKRNASAEQLKAVVAPVLHNPPSALDVTPLILRLLAR